MRTIHGSRHKKVQETSKSTRHPPWLIDEHAEEVAARLLGGCGLTDEIAAELRALVRHRDELCPAVREYLITKLHLTARRNSGLADQLTAFAAQLAADFAQQLALRHDGRAANQPQHPSLARIPAAAQASSRDCTPTAKARISADADHMLEGVRQTQEAIS